MEREWAHDVARHAQQLVSQVVAPVRRSGRTVFECEGRFVAVYPFVVGQMMDREDRVLRYEAAAILAAIHNALIDWRGGPRPPSGESRPAPPPDPPDLHDPALDAWWLSVQDRTFLVSATHGDYYRRNLLCAKRKIVGLIDWHDATVRPLAVELAGATFEMCRDDEHMLQLDRTDEFVTSYLAAGGPLPEHELDVLLPLIRLWIRNDARGSLTHKEQTDYEYAARQMRAFRTLASCEWRPSSVTGG